MPEGSPAENLNSEKPKTPQDWAKEYWDEVKSREADPKNPNSLKENTEEIMLKDLEEGAAKGRLEITPLDKDLNDEDRRKLFAYSEFAKEKGYEFGPYQESADGIRVAEISKERAKVIDLNKYREKISGFFGRNREGIKGARETAIKTLDEEMEGWKDKYKGLKISGKEVWSKMEKRKILGQDVKTLAGSMLLSSGIRFGVKTASGLSGGLFVGAASGAIYGAAIHGFKAYEKKSKEMEEFFARKDELYEKAESIGKEKNIDLKEKLNKYYELVKVEEEFGIGEGKHKLAAQILQDFEKSTRRKEMLRGAIKGSVIGGLGGALGGAIGLKLNESFLKFSNWLSGPKEVFAGFIDARKTVSKEVSQKIQENISEAWVKKYEALRIEKIEALDLKNFRVRVEKGDGLTNIARNLIHDYIAEKKALGTEMNLDKAQLIFAEDSLKNIFGGRAINPDELLEAKGEDIASAIEKAQLLTAAGKANLESMFGDKIPLQEWDRMTDYGHDYAPENNFADEMKKEIAEKTTNYVNEVAEGAGPDGAQWAYEKGKKLAGMATEGKNSFLEDLFATTGVVLSVEHAEAIKEKAKEGLDKTRKKFEKKAPEREYRRIDDFNEGEHDFRPEPKKIIDLEEKNVIYEPGADERTAPEKEIGLDNYEFVEEFPEEKEEKESKSAESKKEKTKVKDKTVNEKDALKEKRKIPDFAYDFFSESGLSLKSGDIEYVVRIPKGERKFATYKDLMRWHDNLSLENQAWLRNRDRISKNIVYLKLPPDLIKMLQESPKTEESFNLEVEKGIKRLLRDEMPSVKNEEKKFEAEEESQSSDIGTPEKEDFEQETRSIHIGNEDPNIFNPKYRTASPGSEAKKELYPEYENNFRVNLNARKTPEKKEKNNREVKIVVNESEKPADIPKNQDFRDLYVNMNPHQLQIELDNWEEESRRLMEDLNKNYTGKESGFELEQKNRTIAGTLGDIPERIKYINKLLASKDASRKK